MSKLYDRASGQWIDVADADVTSSVASGKLAFEDGIDIPAVNAKGESVLIPSRQAEEAFRDHGYRWGTYDDTKATAEREDERILQKKFGEGNTLTALGAGGLAGGTLGLSNVIMPAMGALVGKGEEVRQALGEVKTRNPIAYTTGQVAGTLANPLLRAGGNSLMKTGEGLGARLASGVSNPTAARIVESMAGKAAGSALEGAFYGIGDGISEAALGDPDEVVENLAAGIGYGAVLGGAFGSAFGTGKVAAPYLKSAASAVGGAMSDVVSAAARGTARKTLGALAAVTSSADERRFLEIAGDLADGPASAELRDVFFNRGGADKLRAAVKEARTYETALKKESKNLLDQLNNSIASAPRNIQRQINQDLVETSGDIGAALKTAHARNEGARATFDSIVRSKGTDVPATAWSGVLTKAQRTIDDLAASGDTKAIRKANELTTWLDAQMASRGGAVSNASDEFRLMNELRDRAALGGEKIQGAARKTLSDFTEDLSSRLRKNGLYGEDFAKLEDTRDVYQTVRGFLTGAPKTKDLMDPKMGVMRSVLMDPAKASEFDTLLTYFADLAPDFERVRLAGKNLVGRQNALNGLRNRLDDLRGAGVSRSLDIDDLDELVKAINPSSQMLGKIDRLREVQTMMQSTADMSPLTKFMALSKAMGRPIDGDLAKLAETGEGFLALSKRSLKDGRDPLTESLFRSVMGRVGLGGLMAGPLGALTGGMSAAVSSPLMALKTLTRIEQAARKSAALFDKSMERALTALTSPKTRRVAVVISSTRSGDTLKERRESFKKRAAFLEEMRDPNKLAAEIEARVGSSEDAPVISGALGGHFARTAAFLADKLPTDPLAHQGLNFYKSQWEPSDFELSRFERYVTAAENPTSVLDRIAASSVTPEEIETLQTLYPKIYQRLQTSVMDAIMEPNTELTYEQRLNIGTILDVPADPTLSAQFVANMQATFADEESGGPEGSAPSPSAKRINISIDPQAMQTETQRLTYS